MTEPPAPGPAPLLLRWADLPDDPGATVERLARDRPVVLIIDTGADLDVLPLFGLGVRALVAAVDDPQVETARCALAVQSVRNGGWYVCPELTDSFAGSFRAPAGPERPQLTVREVEVLTGITRGLTHRQVARSLGVQEATVHTYAKRLRRKLGASNKADLTRRAIELSLTSDYSEPNAL